MSHVEAYADGPMHEIRLNDPDRRNALDLSSLASISAAAQRASDAQVLLLTGAGDAFCGGFNVPLMKRDPAIVDQLIAALSKACRELRRCPATVVVDVQGAAIAGGCALAVSADVLIARRGARLGYPVHALGISPAVTIPVLLPSAGGLARSMLMSGRLYRAEHLHRHGVVHALLDPEADRRGITEPLLARGQAAAHATKAWLNVLDGSLDDDRFDGPVEGSRGLRIQ